MKTTIKNIGGAAANDIQWNITVIGRFVLLGKATTGSIASLNASDEQAITSKRIFGFGKAVIKIIATVPESSVSKEQNATILLFFIRMK